MLHVHDREDKSLFGARDGDPASTTADDSVVISDYRTEWPSLYEIEKARLLAAFGRTAVTIDHIGSTSVPDLAAKPIVDILVGVERLPLQEDVRRKLEALGYVYVQDNAPWWSFFRKGMPRTHHLHVMNVRDEDGSVAREKDLMFRDYLRSNSREAMRYVRAKRELAQRFKLDRDTYTRSKTPIINELLDKAGALKRGD